jgi:hypothetical protein
MDLVRNKGIDLVHKWSVRHRVKGLTEIKEGHTYIMSSLLDL